jgi:hypothetical protein
MKKMKIQKVLIGSICLLFILALFLPTDSSAIPAFARRYKISCTTCHAPFPKLKPYGDEFAGNGFIMIENEKERDYITAGDDLLWLNKELPVGVRFDAYALFDDKTDVDKDLQIPWGLKFMSGGTLYKNIGYYFYFYLSERGEVAGIEDAYVHFDNVFSTLLDIMVGQFQTSDPLMKRELRLTFEDYVFYKTRFGGATVNLAYDRGIMLAYGIEQTGTDLVAMVVNGNGKDEAGDDKKFDDDKYKNFGFRVRQAIGDFLSIGGFFYQGKEKHSYPSGTFMNKIRYGGPDFNLSIGTIEITGQYLARYDQDDQLKTAFSRGTRYSQGIIGEVIFAPQLDRSRFYLTGLYNWIDSEFDGYNYETATISGTYLVARNLRLIAEFTRDLQHDRNRFTLGMVSGF